MSSATQPLPPVPDKAAASDDLLDSPVAAENAYDSSSNGVVQQESKPTISIDDLPSHYDAMPHVGDPTLPAGGSVARNKPSADQEKGEDDRAKEETLGVDDQPKIEAEPAAIESEGSGVVEDSAATSKVAEVLDEDYSASLSKGGISMSTLGWSGLAIAGLGLAVGGGGSSAKPSETPTLALAQDSGLAGDTVTNNGVILVSGLVESGSWEYSLDNGLTWIAGQGDRFEIDQAGSYAIVARQLEGERQSDISTVLNVELDFSAPVLGADTALVIAENSGANQIIYSVEAEDASVTYSLASGTDAALSIDSSTGAVSLSDDPDAETQVSYSFTLVATDTAGNVSEQAISLDITDLDEAAPVITSSSTVFIVENSGADQVIYSASADDSADVSAGVIFSLAAGGDSALTIDGATGEVRLSDNPDYEMQGSYSFTVMATDGAGNVGEQAVAVTVQDVDEIPPSINAIESSVQDQMISLRYSENLSSTDLPAISSFTIRQGGLELQVSSVIIVDNTVQLSISTPLSTGALQVSYTGLELKDEAGNSAANFSQIVVSDGYIRGVEVYLDADGDGQADADELLVGVTSNINGEVIFEGDIGSADLIIKGGVNTDTGAVNELSLSAPAGYSVINPLSTLVAQVVKANESDENFSFDQAEQLVVASLGLKLAEGQGLGKYDPLSDVSESSLSNRIATAQIATILSVVVAAATDAETAVSAQAMALGNLVTIITESAAKNDTFVFDASTVAAILTAPDSGTGGTLLVSNSSLVELQSVVAQLEVATSIDDVVATQAAATDSTSTSAPVVGLLNSSDTGVAGDKITSDSSPTVSVAFDANALDGSAAVVGDVIRVFSTLEGQTSTVGSAVITAADLASGAVQITITAISDGVSDLTAQITDIAGNISDSSLLLSVVIDTSAPLFSSSQGAVVDENSGADQIVYTAISSDQVNVTYSMAAGSDSALSVDSSTGEVSLSDDPDEESQASYSFTVVATDVADNTSEQSVTLAVTDLDEIAPTINSAATAAVIENSGASQVIYTASADDSADISGGVTFSLADTSDAALSVNSTTGAVTLNDDPDEETQSSYSFTVVATDVAGNASEQAVTLAVGDVDDTAPTITSQSNASAVDYQSILYAASADDTADISGGVSFGIKPDVGDADLLSIDSQTGVVSLASGITRYSANSSYSFTLLASDGVNAIAEQQITVAVTVPIAVSGPGVLAQGGMRPTLTTDDDGNSVIAITLDPSVVNDYPSGIENVDFTLVYDITELGTVETTQLSYPSGGISAANTSVDGQIGVSIIWFPATVSDGSLLTLTYSADDSVTTTTVRLEDVIVGDDDLTNSTYVLGETVITQGTENAEVFLMSGGSATVAGGVGADIFALTETAGSDMSISDFEAGLDSIQMSSLVSALGYISIAQSGDERQDLSISKLVDIPTDIANLIASNDTALDNTFAAYFSQESSKLTVFVDSATSAGSVDIATYEIGLSGESSFDLDDLQLASPLFIA